MTDTTTPTSISLTPISPNVISPNVISHRDRAVLRAVAAGRCVYAAGTLLVDGICCCDQFVGPRLARAGLIASQSGPARLTADGMAVLDAA